MELSVDPEASPSNRKFFFHTHWKTGGSEMMLDPTRNKWVSSKSMTEMEYNMRRYVLQWEMGITTKGPSPADLSTGFNGVVAGKDNMFYYHTTDGQSTTLSKAFIDHFLFLR